MLKQVIPHCLLAAALAWLPGVGPEASGALVNLTLYNTYALLGPNQATPLSGSAGSGDLVQLVLAGANGAIDAPNTAGSPAGDDTLVPLATAPATATTHVGAGLPGSNLGLLYQINLVYDGSLVGRSFYVRFWNGGQPWSATHYGLTGLFTLPGGDAFGNAEFDFVPLAATAGRSTTVAFAAESPSVPEPRLFVFGAILLGLIARWRLRNADPAEAVP